MSGQQRIENQPLLAIEDLAVAFSTRRGMVEAVRGISLSVT